LNLKSSFHDFLQLAPRVTAPVLKYNINRWRLFKSEQKRMTAVFAERFAQRAMPMIEA
jgi:hypothetical protein